MVRGSFATETQISNERNFDVFLLRKALQESFSTGCGCYMHLSYPNR